MLSDVRYGSFSTGASQQQVPPCQLRDPGAIYRAVRDLQRKYFDPPNLSGGKYE